MQRSTYRGRRAAAIENRDLRVTVLEEGGHVAEIRDKARGVNPLWTPPWPSIEPSAYDPARDTVYGSTGEAKLLAGIEGRGAKLITLTTHAATLEDLFVALTGRELRDA